MAARKIDVNRFTQCVTDAESKGGLSTLGDLYEKVADLYNLQVPQGMKPITNNIAKSNILELKLPIKTVNGRAKAAAVDMKILQECVKTAETNGPLANRSELFALVAEDYNSKTGHGCSSATLQQIVNKAGWTLVTPKGKPGGRKPGTVVVRRPRADKLASDPLYNESVLKLRGTVPLPMFPRLEKTLDKAAKGSLTARIKLKCLDCCNMQPAEVRACQAMDCSLWPIRPYRGKSEEGEENDTDTDTPDVEIEEILEAVA